VLSLHADVEDVAEPLILDQTIEWKEAARSSAIVDNAAVIWSGEVLLKFPKRPRAGPFFALEEAAKAWAFHTALAVPKDEVLEAQIVCWHCAAPLASRILEGGEVEYKRLSRFWE
jgi:hypothetical protein